MIKLPEAASIGALCARITRLEGHRSAASEAGQSVLTLGLPDIDEALPGKGLIVAALHGVSGAGPDTEFGTLPAQLIASPASRRPGPVLWVVDRSPPFAPGLAAYGLCPTHIIFADAGKAVLGVKAISGLLLQT